MIEIEIRHLGDREILHATPAGKREEPLPVIVFYHGFTSSKLVYSYFAVALAQAGFRVVMPDAPDHGARFTGNEQARLGQFWHILHGSLTEFAGLRDALYQAGLVADNRLAVGIDGRDGGAGDHDAPSRSEVSGLSDGLGLLHLTGEDAFSTSGTHRG